MSPAFAVTMVLLVIIGIPFLVVIIQEANYRSKALVLFKFIGQNLLTNIAFTIKVVYGTFVFLLSVVLFGYFIPALSIFN